MDKPPLTILLANPRGFCAGVERAIEIVERALEKFGPPVYVRHEIVHNRYVVEGLEAKGAVFVEKLDEVPEGVPVIFSAHGVPKSVPAEAETRNLFYLDATCPLVSKVHREAERRARIGHQLILIGHAGHPEVIGTMGQLDEGIILLVENVNMIKRHTKPDPGRNVPGGIVEKEDSIHSSNVQLFNPATNKADKVGYKTLGDGRKVRIFKSNGEAVDI